MSGGTLGQRRFDGWGEDGRHIAVQAQRHASVTVVAGFAVVDDDVRRAALGGHQGNGRGREHRQRRSQREHEIGVGRRGGGALQVRRAERLAEADRGWFERSPAAAAGLMNSRMNRRCYDSLFARRGLSVVNDVHAYFFTWICEHLLSRKTSTSYFLKL